MRRSKILGKTQIEIVFGNVVDQGDVDAIVNAANEQLQMGGGVAGAIRSKDASGAIQAACNVLAPVPTGSAVMTVGWEGGPKVIHAIGPVFDATRRKECQEELYETYQSVYEVATQEGCKRIAVVLISSGIFGFTAEKGSSEIAWKATVDWIDAHPEVLELIRFVSLNETAEASALLDCLAD